MTNGNSEAIYIYLQMTIRYGFLYILKKLEQKKKASKKKVFLQLLVFSTRGEADKLVAFTHWRAKLATTMRFP